MNNQDGGNYNMKIKQTAGRDQLSGLADEFAKVNDDILFGEVWSDDDVISPKTRSIITISVMIGKGLLDSSFTHHLAFAKENGVTREEIGRIITHAGFYAGWPNAWAAFRMAKEVFDDDTINHGGYFGMGEENKAYAKYFTGTSYLKTLTPKDTPQAVCNVTFEPGCRNFYHIHEAKEGGGQILLCVEGKGIYKEEGGRKVIMTPGSVVYIPANVKHYHGAFPNCWFSHLAIEVKGEETSNQWLEEVKEEEYLEDCKED